jgi:hypothetical protein
MNVSFDSNDADKENDYSSDCSTTICISRERANSTGKREVLGSFIRDKTKEHLARIENDLDSISFYEIGCCTLKDEMKSFGDA